jgi:uncharacterized MAPEG superfamily protein
MKPMSVELVGLVASVLLGMLHVVLASHAASLQRGYRWTAGARDDPVPPLAGAAGRLARASANYLETFPYFAALSVASFASGPHGDWPLWGVGLYLVGRVAYLPLYAFGVYLARSFAWQLATLGIFVLCIALFK